MIKFSELKKGDVVMHTHLGYNPLVSGVLMESPKQGKGVKSTILVNVKGSEVELFDEIGSIYSNEIQLVRRDDKWIQVDQNELSTMNILPNHFLQSYLNAATA